MSAGLRRALVAMAALAILVPACGGGKKNSAVKSSVPVSADLDEAALFASGKDFIERGKLADGRAHLRRYEQRYPRGPHIEEVKLLIADSFFNESAADQQVEGVALYRQFLTFYPQHPLACTAQFRIAEHHFKNIRSCERDQSETRQAVDEFDKMLKSYPDCPDAKTARDHLAQANDRLACAELEVARFYLRTGERAAAEHRLADLLKALPHFEDRCFAQRLYVELLEGRGDRDTARTVLGRMEEECAASEELARARSRAGVAAPADAPPVVKKKKSSPVSGTGRGDQTGTVNKKGTEAEPAVKAPPASDHK